MTLRKRTVVERKSKMKLTATVTQMPETTPAKMTQMPETSTAEMTQKTDLCIIMM